MYSFAVSHRELFLVFIDESEKYLNKRKEAVLNYLVARFELSDSSVLNAALKARLSKSFYNNFQKRLKKLSKNKRNFENFAAANNSWLDRDFNFSFDENVPNHTVESGKNMFQLTIQKLLFMII